MLGAVEVGRPRRQQAVLVGEVRQQQRLLAVVRDVEGLDAVEARRGEAREPPQDVVVAREVPERVRPDRDAAGVVDRGDRLRDGRGRAPAVGGLAGHEVGLEERRRLVEPGRAQQLGVARDRGGGEVRAADRAADRPARLELAGVRRQAELVEHRDHAVDPRRPVGAPLDEPARERRVGVVDAVAEDVEVLAERVDGRELDRRHDGDRVALGGGQRLGHAVDRVVVGEGEQPHAGSGRRGDDGGRFERPVRADRVRLEVEGRRAAAGAHPGSLSEVAPRRRWRPRAATIATIAGGLTRSPTARTPPRIRAS